jgi:hypothetical protein
MELKIYHAVAGSLHLAQSAQAIAMSATVLEDKLKFQLTNDYFDNLNDVWQNRKIGEKYNLGYVIAGFPLLSAVNHFWALADWNHYIDFVNEGYNPVRWGEYSLSAGLMLYIIGQLSNVTNLGPLLGILLGNGALQLTGLSIEKTVGTFSLYPMETKRIVKDSLWMQQASGFLLLAGLWMPIFISFFTSIYDSEDVPAFVYGVVFNLFFLYMVFGLVSIMYLRGMTQRRPRRTDHYSLKKVAIYDFKTTEKAYAILSLLAKTSLTQLTLFGILGMD